MDASGVSQRLREAISRKGWSVREAIRRFGEAKIRGGSARQVWAIKKGDSVPRLEFIEGAARVLDVSAGWLAFGEGERERNWDSLDYDPSLYGVAQLPVEAQRDVAVFAQQLYGAADGSAKRIEDVAESVALLSRLVMRVLNAPFSTQTFREPKSDVEWLLYIDRSLDALRPLVAAQAPIPTRDFRFVTQRTAR